MQVELETIILFHEKKISNMNDILPIVEQIYEKGEALLIVAEDIEGDARNLLVLNKVSRKHKGWCTKAPGFGDRRKAMLEDLAVLTGGSAILEDGPIQLDQVGSSPFRYLGKAGKVTISKDDTLIVDGEGKGPDVKERRNSIKQQIAQTTSDYDREKLQERMAKLTGGIMLFLLVDLQRLKSKRKRQSRRCS